MSGLTVTVRRDGATGVVVLSGDFDLSGRAQFARAVGRLVADRVSCIRIDAGHLAFMGTSALAALLATRATSDALGIRFQLSPTSTGVRRVVELAGVPNILVVDN
jgi:anti-anti-sigma factor